MALCTSNFIFSPDNGKTGLGTVGDLMQRLQYQVMAKKSKNTEVLKLASEVCILVHQ